jgi:hypothetical protein
VLSISFLITNIFNKIKTSSFKPFICILDNFHLSRALQTLDLYHPESVITRRYIKQILTAPTQHGGPMAAILWIFLININMICPCEEREITDNMYIGNYPKIDDDLQMNSPQSIIDGTELPQIWTL